MMITAGWIVTGIMLIAIIILAAVWWDEWRKR
jgi:hypothetical protein